MSEFTLGEVVGRGRGGSVSTGRGYSVPQKAELFVMFWGLGKTQKEMLAKVDAWIAAGEVPADVGHTTARMSEIANVKDYVGKPQADLNAFYDAVNTYGHTIGLHLTNKPVYKGAEPLFRRLIAAPVEAAPVEAAPVEAAPVEAAPVEAAPVEAAPVEAAPVKPTKSAK